MIGYNPSQVELDPTINDEHVSQEGGQFTPVKGPVQDSAVFAGVSVRTFPRETDHEEIVEFLIFSGLSEDHKDSISLKPNSSVIVEKLLSHECAALIEAIHNKSSFGLYCNSIDPRTLDKTGHPSDTPASSSPGLSTVTTATSKSVSLTDGPSMSPQTTTATPAKTTTTTSLSQTPIMVPTPDSSASPGNPPTLPSLVSPMSPNTFTQNVLRNARFAAPPALQ